MSAIFRCIVRKSRARQDGLRDAATSCPAHLRQVFTTRSSDTRSPIVIGVHPAIWLSAGYTTGPGVDELGLAGGLLGRPVRTVKCETVDIDVPAEAEIVLEGELLPNDHLGAGGAFRRGDGNLSRSRPRRMSSSSRRSRAAAMPSITPCIVAFRPPIRNRQPEWGSSLRPSSISAMSTAVLIFSMCGS